MTVTATPAPTREELRADALAARRPRRVAFRALLLRDLVVLRKNIKEFLPRTLLQPLLLVFVFAYVFPKIGQSVGGSGAGASEFSTALVAGRGGARGDLPGHPVGGAADGAGVRVHA